MICALSTYECGKPFYILCQLDIRNYSIIVINTPVLLQNIKFLHFYSHLTIIFLAYFCQSIINNIRFHYVHHSADS